MKKNISKMKNKNLAGYSLKALSFSPWLIVIYLMVSGYVVKLNTSDQDVIKGSVEWFGTAYSFILAIVLTNVVSQFEDTNRKFDVELTALSNIYWVISNTLPKSKKVKNFETKRKLIIDNIKYYILHVIKNCSKEYSIRQLNRNGSFILETIGGCINSLAFDKILPDSIISQLYDMLSQVVDARTDRIARSKRPINTALITIANFVSMAWILSFIGLPISSDIVAIFVVGSATFIIIMIIAERCNDLGYI